MTLARAIETGDLAELPGRRDEDWRWTDLRGLIRAMPPASPRDVAWATLGPFGEVGDGEVLVVNGRFPDDSRITLIREGEDKVVRLRFLSTVAGHSHTASARFIVPPGARLTVLESYEGAAEGYVTDIALQFDVEEGGMLERIVIADDAPGAISVSQAVVFTAPGAQVRQTVLAGGALRQRIETRVGHAGKGASLRLDGAYILGERQHSDQTTVVDHLHPGGTTSQLIKGAVAGQARGVFQGRIVVEHGADQTDARMGHHALVLSDRAEVDAKPELLIYADDVSCAHGNTVGALDEDALFYARQRGIPESEAKAMLTLAFVGEVVDRIEHEEAREVCRDWVARKLEGLR